MRNRKSSDGTPLSFAAKEVKMIGSNPISERISGQNEIDFI
jgi:hypothetical protein